MVAKQAGAVYSTRL